jgi:hypothetical protein
MNRVLRQGLITMPGVGVSLLPKLACPICWPAYAALLSSVGLGFLITAKYLLPVTAAFLVLGVTTLAIRARLRRGYGPFVLGSLAAAGVLSAKFWWESSLAMYAAIGLLVIASTWNVWPRRVAGRDCCAEKQMS